MHDGYSEPLARDQGKHFLMIPSSVAEPLDIRNIKAR
jgi:hypothetical protein